MSSSSPIDPTALLRSVLEHDGPEEPTDSIREHIVESALRHFEQFGITRSTMGDITRRSGLARMTLYRRFANKRALIDAVVMREAARFLSRLQAEIDAQTDVEAKLSEGFVFTLRTLGEHGLLQRLLETEPEAIVPALTVEGAPIIAVATEFLATEISRNLDDGRTHEELLVVAELIVRLVVSFLLTPTSVVRLDDPDNARSFARTYIRPLIVGNRQA